MPNDVVIALPTDREQAAEMLERMARDVRDGRVTNIGVALVLKEPDGDAIGTGFGSIDSHPDLPSLLGAIAILNHRVIADFRSPR